MNSSYDVEPVLHVVGLEELALGPMNTEGEVSSDDGLALCFKQRSLAVTSELQFHDRENGHGEPRSDSNGQLIQSWKKRHPQFSLPYQRPVVHHIIREVFVKLLLDSFGKLSIRVDGRTYLLSGVIDDSEANRIIRDPKLELESSRFTFDLVSPSYESVDVVVGENWMLRHKAEMDLVGFTPCRRIGFRMELVQGATPICEGSCRLTSLERKEVWNDCRSCKVRVGSNGNLLWKAPVLLGRKKGG
ncbi:hypothetical protein Tco_1007409 [Tanacetum coccineum]